MLTTLPRLQKLILYGVYTLASPGLIVPTVHSVRLPHLTEFGFKESRTGFVHMLEHLSLPATTIFRFDGGRMSRGGDKRLATAIRNNVLTPTYGIVGSAHKSPVIRSIFVCFWFGSRKPRLGPWTLTLEIRMWTATQSLEALTSPSTERDTESDLKLDLSLSTDDSKLPGIIDELMVKGDLHEVTSMVIACYNQCLAVSDWQVLLRTVPNLQALALVSYAYGSLADAVGPTPRSDGSHDMLPSAQGLYPSLKVLRLVGPPIANCHIHREDGGQYRWPTFLDALKTLTKVNGLALHRLEIAMPINFTSSNHQEIVAAGIAEVVDVLDWGRSSYEKCTVYSRHPEESEHDLEARIQRHRDDDWERWFEPSEDEE